MTDFLYSHAATANWHEKRPGSRYVILSFYMGDKLQWSKGRNLDEAVTNAKLHILAHSKLPVPAITPA